VGRATAPTHLDALCCHLYERFDVANSWVQALRTQSRGDQGLREGWFQAAASPDRVGFGGNFGDRTTTGR